MDIYLHTQNWNQLTLFYFMLHYTETLIVCRHCWNARISTSTDVICRERQPYLMYYQIEEESVSAASSALPLHSAIVSEYIHHIQKLLSDSAVDVNAQDENEFTSLTVAILMNKQELLW